METETTNKPKDPKLANASEIAMRAAERLAEASHEPDAKVRNIMIKQARLDLGLAAAKVRPERAVKAA